MDADDRLIESSEPPWAIRLRVKHLLMLVALQREGSVRKAAESMFMTQPAASKLLKDAEEIFGVRLFDRGPRGLRITDSGALIVERTVHLLNGLKYVRDAVAEAATGVVGVVRVGVLPVAIPTVVADAVVELYKRAPRLRIEVVESSASQLLSALRRGEFDCVIGRMSERPAPRDLDRVVLYRESVCVVCRADHPLAHRRRVTLADATEWSWILPSDRTPLREYLEESWEAKRLRVPLCTLQTVSTQAVVSTLRRSDFVAVMPNSTATLFVDIGVLARIPIALSWKPLPIELMTLRESQRSGALAMFIESVRRAASSIAAA